ncbi:MAG: alcohol dehydrogenase catalytic domain-containing protein, partial [Patescibacteria group bacterium]
MKSISALTFDTKEDGWETSKGFIMRQMPMPVLDEENIPKDKVSVILKMKYAGLCGSDRGIWNRASFKDLIYSSLERKNKTTRILGHEFLGEVTQMGSMVKQLYSDSFSKEKIEVGSLVSGDSHVTCGKCYQCKIGQNNVCINEAILGISIDGVFAEYVKIPAKNLWPVNIKAIRPEIAAILDPFGNAVHALSKFDPRSRQVAVLGAGPIGLFSILLLKNSGASKIIAADISEKNLQLAKELGAHETVHIKNGADIAPKILEMTDGRGADVAMEMAGPNSSVNTALEITRRGGQVVLFGLKDGDFTIPKF